MRVNGTTNPSWPVFGQKLKAWRERRGLSQESLCEAVGAAPPRLGQSKLSGIEAGDREPPDREMCRRLEAALTLPRDEIWTAAARARMGEAEWELWRSKMLAVGLPDLSATESNIVHWLREIDRNLESGGGPREVKREVVSPTVEPWDYFPERPNTVASGLSELLLVLATDRNTQEGDRDDAAQQFADALAHMIDLSPYSRARVVESMHASIMAAIGNRSRRAP